MGHQNLQLVRDPFLFKEKFWPDVLFYDRQCECIQSVVDNDETYIYAGNMLGKDYQAGFIALWYFMAHDPCRILTTSVADDHLRVLWEEIERFLRTAKTPLLASQGGVLVRHHREIRKVWEDGELVQGSYMIGAVCREKEKMAGHHAKHTLCLGDEASAIDDEIYDAAQGWAKRMLWFGNPNQCENFYRKARRAGDIKRLGDFGYHRKVIRIKAEDAPDVRRGLGDPTVGQIPSGVLTYPEYVKRRATWDRVRQCVGLDGEFYEGAEQLLFPPEWLNRAEQKAREFGVRKREAKSMGIDPGQGTAKTAWTVVDEYGIIEQVAFPTPNTTDVTARTIALGEEYGIEPKNWVFDAGGGGKQHADRLRDQGYNVRTIFFGETMTPPVRRYLRVFRKYQMRLDEREIRHAYKNRRAQMYGEASLLLDPDLNEDGFGISEELVELRHQLAVMPKLYDEEGKLYLPPKDRKLGDEPKMNKKTLIELIGRSPDEADSFVLAVHGLLHEPKPSYAGVV